VGFDGIRLWDDQLINDVMFAILVIQLVIFAFVYRTHFKHFYKMIKDAFLVRKRQSLFTQPVANEGFFRNFMLYQALLLCSIAAYSIARAYNYLDTLSEKEMFITIGVLFLITVLFFQIKQALYFLLGVVLDDHYKYKLWKTSYNAILGLWGVLLYIPVLWLTFVTSYPEIPIILFVFLYILCRFAIIYKTIRIFHKKIHDLFYIILYLCGQEILPLVFLYEGLTYLYNFIETSTLWH